MPGAPIAFPLANPTTASALVAQAGVTQLPGDASGVLLQSISGIAGWEFSETTGSAAAHVRLWDGTSTSAPARQLADVMIPAGETIPSDEVAQVVNGAVYLQVAAGSVAGEVLVSE